ncbi:hypothetical protein HGP17_15490 [Rhizobium sp. P38BS-XIX]|nr:hypothetical protein [Rhizobium sp. P38BS-XIX]
MTQESKLMALIRAGKRQEALDMVERLKSATPVASTSIKVDRKGMVTYYKGDRRFMGNTQSWWAQTPKKK